MGRCAQLWAIVLSFGVAEELAQLPPILLIASLLTFYQRPKYILFSFPLAVLACCFGFNIGRGYAGLSLLLAVTYLGALAPAFVKREEIAGLVAIALMAGSYHAIVALSSDISSPIHKIEDRGSFVSLRRVPPSFLATFRRACCDWWRCEGDRCPQCRLWA